MINELMRRRAMLAEGGNLLPQGYTQLEYLASASKSIILTPFVSGDTFEVDAICTNIGLTQILLGYADYGGTWMGALGTGKWGLGSSNYINVDASARTLLQVTYTSSKAILTANGLTVERNGGTSSGNVHVFGYNQAYRFVGQIYDIKQYRNNVLIAHFVPCTEDATSNVGFYDVINNIFIQY